MKRIKEIFNPNKITIARSAKIISTNSGKYVVKDKNKDIKSLYSYLDSRAFNNYPNIIDEYDDKYVYDYIEEINTPINQKSSDMALLLASLHNKTSYFKPISLDEIKRVYETLLNNINYFDNKMNEYFSFFEKEEYMSPSSYLLMRNQSRILSLISFLRKELEVWYKLCESNTKIRVVYCHNNLSIDHYINDSFISWDNYTIDSPVLDLINLYQQDFEKYDFSNFLEVYLSKYELLDDEAKLLFINISIPKEFILSNNEMDNTIRVGRFINYINETEKLIRPYYSIKDIK